MYVCMHLPQPRLPRARRPFHAWRWVGSFFTNTHKHTHTHIYVYIQYLRMPNTGRRVALSRHTACGTDSDRVRRAHSSPIALVRALTGTYHTARHLHTYQLSLTEASKHQCSSLLLRRCASMLQTCPCAICASTRRRGRGLPERKHSKGVGAEAPHEGLPHHAQVHGGRPCNELPRA